MGVYIDPPKENLSTKYLYGLGPWRFNILL